MRPEPEISPTGWRHLPGYPRISPHTQPPNTKGFIKLLSILFVLIILIFWGYM
jgi:hypothetical protein